MSTLKDYSLHGHSDQEQINQIREDMCSMDNAAIEQFSREEFEIFMSERNWSEEVKQNHRNLFTGTISRENGQFKHI